MNSTFSPIVRHLSVSLPLSLGPRFFSPLAYLVDLFVGQTNDNDYIRFRCPRWFCFLGHKN